MTRPKLKFRRKKYSFTLSEDTVSILDIYGGENKSIFVDEVFREWLLYCRQSGIYEKKYGGVSVSETVDGYCFVDSNNDIVEEYGFYKTIPEILGKADEIIKNTYK